MWSASTPCPQASWKRMPPLPPASTTGTSPEGAGRAASLQTAPPARARGRGGSGRRDEPGLAEIGGVGDPGGGPGDHPDAGAAPPAGGELPHPPIVEEGGRVGKIFGEDPGDPPAVAEGLSEHA